MGGGLEGEALEAAGVYGNFPQPGIETRALQVQLCRDL